MISNFQIIIGLFKLFMITSIDINVHDDFQFCHLSTHQKPINTKQMCSNEKTVYKNFLLDIGAQLNKTFIDLNVLSRSDNNINGKAFECQMFLHNRTYHTSWTLRKSHKDAEIKIVNLNEQECRNMVYNHKCGNDDMPCDKDGCKFMNEPPFDENNWSYFTTIDPMTSFKTCRIIYRDIISHSNDDQIFSHNCFIKNLYCKLDYSIIIWDLSIISVCPFFNIKKIRVKLDELSLIDENDNVLYEYLEPESICNIPSIKTKSGLNLITIESLSKITNMLLDNHKTNDFQTFNRFSMAEHDFDKFIISKKDKELSEYECKTYLEFMDTQKNFNKKFFRKSDLNSIEKIFFVKNKQIYIPICIEVKNIIIESNLAILDNKCDVYPKIKFFLGSSTFFHTAYYHSSGILSLYGEISDCPIEPIYFFLPNNERYILQHGRKYSLVSKNDANLKSLDIQNFRFTSIELKHSNVLFNKLANNPIQLITHEEKSTIENHPIYKVNRDSGFKDIYKYGENIFLKISSIWTLFCIFMLLITALILVILFKLKCCNFLCIKKCLCCCLLYKPKRGDLNLELELPLNPRFFPNQSV